MVKGKHRVKRDRGGNHFKRFRAGISKLNSNRKRIIALFSMLFVIVVLIPTLSIQAENGIGQSYSNYVEEFLVDRIQSINIPIIVRDYKADGFFFEPAPMIAYDNHDNNNPYECTCLSAWVFHNFWADNELDNESGKPTFTDEGMIDFLAKTLWREKMNQSENLALESNVYGASVGEIFELALNNVYRYDGGTSGNSHWNTDESATFSEAVNWYSNAKYKEYKEIRNEINTPYRYIYYYMNKFFEYLPYDNSDVVNGIEQRVYGNNTSFESGITLNLDEDGTYIFSSKNHGGFFPINGLGFGNELKNIIGYPEVEDKNYHFSVEGKTNFVLGNDIKKKYNVNGNEDINGNIEGWKFSFSGDDDVWIYLNGKKVIDLAGIHHEEEAWFIITTDGKVIASQRIEQGDAQKGRPWNDIGTYEKGHFNINVDGVNEFSFYYMERHTYDSNLTIKTNMKFVDKMTLDKFQYTKENEEIQVVPNDSEIYIGDRLYYRFRIANTSNVEMRDVELNDEILGFTINNQGVFKNGEITNYDIKIIRNGQVSDLSVLRKMEKDDVIEIICEDVLFVDTGEYREYDSIKNTVKITSYYTTPQNNNEKYEGSADCNVRLKGIENIKYSAVMKKSIAKIIQADNSVINKSEDIANHKFVPTDKVIFKVEVKNKSIGEKNGQVVNIAIDNLILKDELWIVASKTEGKFEDQLINDQWTFYNDEELNEVFNNYGFRIEANSSRVFYTMWEFRTDEVNKVIDLPKGTVINNTAGVEKSDDSSFWVYWHGVDMEIQPASFRIMKKVFDEKGSQILDDSKFSIIVKSEEGKEYAIEIKAGEAAFVFENMKYQNYTVVELVPMNYELKCIVGNKISIVNDGDRSGSIFLDGTNNDGIIIFENMYVSRNGFYDESNIENQLKIQ